MSARSHPYHPMCGCWLCCEAEDNAPDAPVTRSPWRPLKQDVLDELARCRNTGARGRSAAYARAREDAMRPVCLPGVVS